jgi:hypothetical protein
MGCNSCVPFQSGVVGTEQGNRTKIRFNENQSHNCHFVAFSEDAVTKSGDGGFRNGNHPALSEKSFDAVALGTEGSMNRLFYCIFAA